MLLAWSVISLCYLELLLEFITSSKTCDWACFIESYYSFKSGNGLYYRAFYECKIPNKPHHSSANVGEVLLVWSVKVFVFYAQIQPNAVINNRGLTVCLPFTNCYHISRGKLNPDLCLRDGWNNTILGSVCRCVIRDTIYRGVIIMNVKWLHCCWYVRAYSLHMITRPDVCLHTSILARVCFPRVLTSGLNLSVFPATGWAGKWQALSKISAVFAGMMGISGTFPTAVKSSAFPAPLNTPGSFPHPAWVPIKQLRRLVFGNSRRPKGVINSRETVFTVRAH